VYGGYANPYTAALPRDNLIDCTLFRINTIHFRHCPVAL